MLGEIPSAKEAYQLTLKLALPAVAETMLASVIQTMDTIMVGVLGPAAIASVGITNQPRMIAMALFMALNIGITAICAHSKGEKRQDNARSCLKQGLVVSLLLGILVSALLFTFSFPLMKLAGANSEIIGDANTYFRIMMVGTLIQSMTLTITAAQRGVGNTKISFKINMTANLVNVFFNFCLINGNLGFPKLGVAGAAIASVIGLSVGLVMAISTLIPKTTYLHLSLKAHWKPDWRMLQRIWAIGSNAALEQLAMRVGFFLFARIVADLGTTNFATHQICMQLLNLGFTVGDGMSIAATALVGQNLGAKRPDLSILYGKCAQRIGICFSVVLFSLFFFLGGPLVSLFTNDLTVIQIGARLMRIAAIVQIFQVGQVIYSGCLRGAGDNRYVALVMLITTTLLRPTISFLCVNILQFGIIGAWAAVAADQFLRFVLMAKRFASGKWTEKKV